MLPASSGATTRACLLSLSLRPLTANNHFRHKDGKPSTNARGLWMPNTPDGLARFRREPARARPPDMPGPGLACSGWKAGGGKIAPSWRDLLNQVAEALTGLNVETLFGHLEVSRPRPRRPARCRRQSAEREEVRGGSRRACLEFGQYADDRIGGRCADHVLHEADVAHQAAGGILDAADARETQEGRHAGRSGEGRC